jgi:hypothetical protein
MALNYFLFSSTDTMLRTKASTLDFASHFGKPSSFSFAGPDDDEQDQSSAATVTTDDVDHAAWNDLFTTESKATDPITAQPDSSVIMTKDDIQNEVAAPSSPILKKPHPRSPTSPTAASSHTFSSPPTKYRRSSMASQYTARQQFFPQSGATFQPHPPLPHHPQAHFYSPPQINIPLPSGPTPRAAAGDGEYYCGFDSSSSAGGSATLSAEDVVLIGWEGGLDIYKVTTENMDLIGRLSDLPGSVIDAKVISAISQPDQLQSLFPLVAVIINGPSLAGADRSNRGPEEEDGIIRDDIPSGKAPSLLDDEDNTIDTLDQYKTSVEIYSLSQNQLITTLLSSAEIPLAMPLSSPLFNCPQSSGHLSLQTSGRYVTVSSGESGEVFIFQSDHTSDGDGLQQIQFRCIGKVWASLSTQSPRNHSRSPSASRFDQPPPTELYQDQYPIGTPLVSLKHRWLAYSPATPSRPFIGATAYSESPHPRVPGLSSHRAPPQPQISCALEVPEGDGVMKWVAREVTQEVIKSAKWVGGKAIQTFNSFWNPTNPQESQSSPSQGPVMGDGSYNTAPQFPPTHAPAATRAQTDREPPLISIIDLEKLGKTHSPPSVPPASIATFPALQGCSFLSFATDGLHLLVTSAKGDNHVVWDLMRLTHGKSREAISKGIQLNSKPRVRQIAIFYRLTPSTTVDVVWSESVPSRFAVVTEKGTVHVHDLPEYALQWPPRRRARKSKSGQQDESKIIESSERPISASGAATTAVNAMSAAFKMVNDTAQPIITAAHRRNDSTSSTQQTSGHSISTFNRKPSGHAVAQGLSKSLGAATGTVNNIRNVNENLLRIPNSGNKIRQGCVHWLGGAHSPQLAVVGGGFLRIHGVGSRLLDEKGEKKRVTVAKSTTQFALPHLPEFKIAPVFAARVDLEGKEPPRGFWSSPSIRTIAHIEEPHLLSHAELDTNPPYQPFHADRRINMYVYDLKDETTFSVTPPHTQDDEEHMENTTAWTFGEELSTRKQDFGFQQHQGGIHEDGLVTATENSLVLNSKDEVLEQVVFTTRRNRRGRKKLYDHLEPTNEDGFFEEDCEILDFVHDGV